jgi:anti-anti-sigma factor
LFQVRHEPRGSGVVVIAAGEIDLATSPQLREALLNPAVNAATVVLDLREVTFIDSSGLSSLITASARARERTGTVALVLAGEAPPSIFRFRGVDRLLALYGSREAALAGLS